MLVKPERKRKKSRPRMRWMDGVEKDLRNLCVVNWKTKAQERNGWRKFSEQAKTHKGLSANNNNNSLFAFISLYFTYKEVLL
jgi:hypothetical protein